MKSMLYKTVRSLSTIFLISSIKAFFSPKGLLSDKSFALFSFHGYASPVFYVPLLQIFQYTFFSLASSSSYLLLFLFLCNPKHLQQVFQFSFFLLLLDFTLLFLLTVSSTLFFLLSCSYSIASESSSTIFSTPS